MVILGKKGNFKNTNCCFIIPASSHLMTYSLWEDLTLFFLLLTGTWYSPGDETLPVLAMILVGKAKGETCYARSIWGFFLWDSETGTRLCENGKTRNQTWTRPSIECNLPSWPRPSFQVREGPRGSPINPFFFLLMLLSLLHSLKRKRKPFKRTFGWSWVMAGSTWAFPEIESKIKSWMTIPSIAL